MPKFALLVRATALSESGQLPPDMGTLLTKMTEYNTLLIDSGVLVAGDGFQRSSFGARVHFSSTSPPTVSKGPFELGSLVSGYWIIKAANLDEAVEWARKIPFATDDGVVEVRQVSGPEDFGEHMTEELKAKDDELREKLEKQEE
ncbi:YCII-related protein [Cercophora newfieldiana]|uniref:YCII-related protein n=1 Tax=Cercophora newfieldiana TaxID=92897 RepID=A0AA40CY24_9PEZI|nr:YCII-related protein [Cercophora newfieldiana]